MDAYEEEGIYLWDVAASLTLVVAAGGSFSMLRTRGEFEYHVSTWNGKLIL